CTELGRGTGGFAYW
nr:immunoglobulin heavy chain junction region [Mus musculus]MBK4183728.1 immunoglobulin heavy chain junction region [Mus musculus]